VSPSIASKKLAAFAAGALIAGSTVAIASVATAAEVTLTTTYTCTNALIGAGDISGELTVDMPTSAPSGSTVPSRPVGIKVTIPDAIVDTMRGLTVSKIQGTATGLTYRVGPQTVPMSNASIPETALPGDGPMTLETTATASSFVAQTPGFYPVKVPLNITVNATATTLIGPNNQTIQCTLKSGAPDLIGTLTVTPIVKKASTTSATVLNKPITTAKRPKVLVKVTAVGTVPTGTVKAKLGRKLLKTGTLSGGKVRLLLPKLSAGDKKVKFIYSGSLTVKPSSKVIVIRVRRA